MADIDIRLGGVSTWGGAGAIGAVVGATTGSAAGRGAAIVAQQAGTANGLAEADSLGAHAEGFGRQILRSPSCPTTGADVMSAAMNAREAIRKRNPGKMSKELFMGGGGRALTTA